MKMLTWTWTDVSVVSKTTVAFNRAGTASWLANPGSTQTEGMAVGAPVW